MSRQKGTGSRPSRLAPVNLFRGGGRSFGPTPRSHEIGLPKKVRALALRHALSAKAKDGGIIVLDKATVKDGKTKALQNSFAKLGLVNALIIDGAEVDANFARPRATFRISTCCRCRASTSTTSCDGTRWC